jgi:hypothetical protein
MDQYCDVPKALGKGFSAVTDMKLVANKRSCGNEATKSYLSG